MVMKGIFLVRFMAMDTRDKILTGYYFFDNKPLIMKPWDAEMDLEKEELRYLPIWIQLKLNFNYWGERALFKIVKQIGQSIKTDDATKNRDKLQYARVLIEVNLKQKLPDQVQFRNEHGEMIDVGIHYEWRPVFCDKCKNIGHLTTECRNLRSKKQWVPKTTIVVNANEAQCSDKAKPVDTEVGQEGFQRALKPIRVRVSPT